MFKSFSVMALVCSAMACNNRPAVPGERCFTPENSFATNISEVCELGQKAERECYLRYRNDTKGSITCKQVDAMKQVAGAGL
jgi:hypothetical protein